MFKESLRNIVRNPYLIGGAAGGLTQLGFESMAIAFKERYSGLKFPDGFASLNPVEELLEGSIATNAGVVLGRYGYRFASRLAGVPPNPDYETLWMLFGGAMGYTAMTTLGFILHPYLGIHDVKWGPFAK